MSTIKEILYGTQPVFRRNFIQENVKHLRGMQKYCRSAKTDDMLSSRTNCVRCMTSKPRLQSSQSISRDNQMVRTAAKRVARPITAINANTMCNGSEVCAHGSGTLPLQQTKCTAAKHQLQTDRVFAKCKGERVFAKCKGEICKTGMQNGGVTKSVQNQHSVAGKDLNPEDLRPPQVALHSCPTFKDASSQTLVSLDANELYKEGVIIYPSPNVLMDRKASDKPICIDSASQTNKDHNLVDTCAPLQDVPVNQICSENIDNLKVQEMKIDDCKENVQDERKIPTNSRRNSSKQKCASASSDLLKLPATYQKGAVPRYLRERQQQWQRAIEEELANTPDPSCPAGHVLLPEEERQQTLDIIRTDYASLVRELNMMPVRADTLRVRQKKIELEQKLTKLEEASKVFSRPKVFVKVGE